LRGLSMALRGPIVEVSHEQADRRHRAPQDAARPLRRLGGERRRADHRGFRRRPARGPDRAVAAFRDRRRSRAPQGTRRLRLDLRARARPRREVGAAETSVRRSRLRAVRARQHHHRDKRRTQAQLRMGPQEPVRAAAQCPLSALQFERSRARAARLASTNNLALMLNLFHNETFVFDNGYDFPERQGAAKYFSGEGEFIPVRPGRNMWETNFVPDLAGFELKTWEQRGAGGSNMMF